MLWRLLALLVLMGILIGAIALAAYRLDQAIEQAKRGSGKIDRRSR
ncbi:MAG: hypothetical protein SNJ57_12075 [Cyanobacteriota bacterium]